MTSTKPAKLWRTRERQKSSSSWVRAWGGLQQCLWRLRKSLSTLTNNVWFDQFTLAVVVVNTCTLVAETFESLASRAWYFSAIECLYLPIYLLECILKLLASGRLYFKNPWNYLDFVIVIMSLFDMIFHQMEETVRGLPSFVFSLFKILKGLRAVRVLRTIRLMPDLQTVVRISLQSLQAIASILLLISFVLYVFAVIFCNIFSKYDEKRFGNMFRTMLTLFELLTLDDWWTIYSTSCDSGGSHIIVFLVLYIVIQYFILLNLATTVILDNFQLAFKKRKASQIKQPQDKAKTKELLAGRPQKDGLVENTLEPACTKEDTSGIGETFHMREYHRLKSIVEHHHHTFHTQARTSDLLFDSFFEAPNFQGNLEE